MAAELGTAAFSGIITEVVFYGTIQQEIRYVFKCQSYINELKNQVQQLRNKTEREQRSIDHTTQQGDEIHKDVDQWLTEVNQFIEQVADPITGNEGQPKMHCFKGLCTNSMTRYKLSKKAVKAGKDVKSLGKELQ